MLWILFVNIERRVKTHECFFSDEAQIIIGKNKRVYAWRKKHEEKWKSRCLDVHVDNNFPVLSVMFWGCLTYEGVGTLAVVEGNILKSILK